MRVCAYVMGRPAKASYAHECFDVRQNAGLMVAIDILERSGVEVELAGSATVGQYDVVLVSITSDCDWWPLIAEMAAWPKGRRTVIAGGAGVLNVRPVLEQADYFCLGRAEGIIDKLVLALWDNQPFEHPSIIDARTFDPGREYVINQVAEPYPHEVALPGGQGYREGGIGCNHRCLFCGYTWHRKHTGGSFEYSDLWAKERDVEVALLDIAGGREVDYGRLRTTAVDGMSERLRFAVNKRITREALRGFLVNLHTSGKPHQVKLYNVLGYPSETDEDWRELAEDIRLADEALPPSKRQTSLLLHSTPFRAMPATPMATAAMSYCNYRGEIARVLGAGRHKGNVFFRGRALWAVESMGTESLATVIQSAIMLRGTEADAENVVRVARSRRFASATAAVRQATLERYFDVGRLFGAYAWDDLPTRYLRTYARVEKMGGPAA